jgi:hypothetical protein
MFDLQKISEDAFIDELNKIAMSEEVIKRAIEGSHNKALHFLSQFPIKASNISAAAKKVKQSTSLREALHRRRNKIGYNL